VAAKLILDSGALSALALGDERVRAWARESTRRGMLVAIPAPVLTETMQGNRADASIHRVIASDETIIATTGRIAQEAGRLRFRTRGPDSTVDAIIVATAAEFPISVLLTGDPVHMERLARELPPGRVHVRSINAAKPDF